MWSSIGVICALLISVFGQEVVQVNITQGTVVGSRATDGNYFEFHGIPYADSTSGSHRFQAPSPPPLFTDTFIADRRDIICVRALGVGYEGTEDCLVANVFTPTVNNTERLPVMVWIKGREFNRVYEPELSFGRFTERDVVVVSLNFRESILGFLCLGTETAPGNAGLKDIIAGLRWIQENIAYFGGDPESVTLFGHGSGGAAVDLISLSPMAEDLVHKVISQSGTATAPWAVTRDNLRYAIEVATALGHTVDDTEALSEIFRRTSVSALMAIINELQLTDNSLAFAPCIENEALDDVEPFLIRSPYDIINSGDFLQIPFMTGFVDNEGTIRAEEALEDDWLERMEDSFTDFIQPDLDLGTGEREAQLVEDIRNFYFGNESITLYNIADYISYHGDTMMLVSTLREVRMRAAISNSSIYLYQFSYKGSLGEPFVGPVDVNTAAHSEELAYLFRDANENGINVRDLTISDILVERWTNFARDGLPTTEISQIEWRPFTLINTNYIRFLDDDEIISSENATLEIALENPHPETLAFWDPIYEENFQDAVAPSKAKRLKLEEVWIDPNTNNNLNHDEPLKYAYDDISYHIIWSEIEDEHFIDASNIIKTGGNEDNYDPFIDILNEDDGSGDEDDDSDDNNGNSATAVLGNVLLLTFLFALSVFG